jgi:4'-phosphopantetheinyl transferase
MRESSIPIPRAFDASSWCAPPDALTLGSNEVHVWRAALDQTSSEVRAFHDLLTTDEQHRADRFYFPKDREHFVVARGALRRILGRYLDTDPKHLRFSYTAFGKPALTDATGGKELRFNVSHSKGMALYAITRGRDLGVDVELLREDFEGLEIAHHFFSRREVATLNALPDELRTRAFFNCWTRKEAYIKARGEGLSLPLDRFDVSLVPGEPAALLRTRHNPQEASRWDLQELFPGRGYVAAIAVEGCEWRLSLTLHFESSQ